MRIILKKKIALSNSAHKAPFHRYSIEVVLIWCQLVISCSTSLRGASRVLTLLSPYLHFNLHATPSWYTGRLWLLRLGYYKLMCDKTHADDWIWIIDHSVQTGHEKCLLILGVRLSDLPEGRAITYQDVEPIELIPVEKSNGEIVYQQLESTIEKTGIPRAIVGDYGTDIKAGVEKFCKAHAHTSFIYDVKHKMASLLKKQLEHDPRWEEFTQQASKCKQQVQQTELAPLAPAKQRTKARYMNIEHLLNWANKLLKFQEKSDQLLQEQGYGRERLNDKFGWLSEFSSDLRRWQSFLDIASITEHVIRIKGIHPQVANELREKLNNQKNLLKPTDQKVRDFKKEALKFARKESNKSRVGERLLGSSEIIESVYGKQKFIEKEQSKSGFTGLILTLGAVVSKTTAPIVEKALAVVSTKTIREWYEKNIHRSLQAKRIQAFANEKSGTNMELTM